MFRGKIRKFQFDKKETCVSKLLMKFTHTHTKSDLEKEKYKQYNYLENPPTTELNGIWKKFVNDIFLLAIGQI